MKVSYKPENVCSNEINFEIDNGVIKNVNFVSGCTGNLQGISKLVEGMKAEEALVRLKGIQCRNGTSCPDQFARAIEQAIAK